MVWGIRLSDSWWSMHNERGYFKLNINEDLGNPKPEGVAGIVEGFKSGKETPFAFLSCITNQWSDFLLDTCYDQATEDLVFRVVMPQTSWFGIGFGPSMTNTDMITWTTKDGIASVEDQYSYGHSPPRKDIHQNINSMPAKLLPNGKIQIMTRRPLDTADVQDYLFKLNEENVMCYGHRTNGSSNY